MCVCVSVREREAETHADFEGVTINSHILVVACVQVKEDIVIGRCVNKVEGDTRWMRWVARWGRREQPVD